MEILVCPSCGKSLLEREDRLACSSCESSYPVTGGIPSLFHPGESLTIDPGDLTIKSRDEAIGTIRGMNSIDSGFIKKPSVFYLLYASIILFAVAAHFAPLPLLPVLPAAVYRTILYMLLLILPADWIVFRINRGRTLSAWERSPLRLRTAADHSVVDDVYRRTGKSQPTMADWIALSAGPPRGKKGIDTDDARYLDIHRVFERRRKGKQTVVDVGANDGRACFEYGIGKDDTFIGVDVSMQLLEEFSRNLPGKVPVHADGTMLPLADGTVDFLFCTETLEHLSDPGRAFAEFARVLKPGGTMMIQSPNAHRLRNLNIFHIGVLFLSLINDRILQKKSVHENTWINAATYHWDFSVQDYRKMAGDGGFTIEELRSSGFFFPGFLLHGNPGRYRLKERFLGAIPAVRFLGNDLVLVARKGEKALDPPAGGRSETGK